jgi:putative RecB family exonuclease
MEEKKVILTDGKKKLELSASRVKTYKQCPRKYYYSYIEKLPKKDWDHFDLGTFVHGVLERFHSVFKKSPMEIDLNGLMTECFKKQREFMNQNKVLSTEILNNAKEILKLYLKNMKEDGLSSEVLNIEDDFIIDLNEKCKIRGVVDRLDVDNDGIFHIKDYKTSKDPKYMEPEQLIIYGIYLFNKFENIDRFRASYIMLRFGNMHIPYDLNREDVEKEKKKLIECADNILEEERWISRPTRLCDWCDFKSVCLNSW